MKKLSEVITQHLKDKNITTAQLARSCNIDRSTMLQYLNGKRALKNPEHINQIMDHLHLTLPEREAVLKVYRIELMGYDLYCQRDKIDWFLRSLSSLSDCPSASVEMDYGSLSIQPMFYPGAIANKLELSQTILALLYAAHRERSEIKILMQPHEASLLNLLLQPVFVNSEMKITHILCMDTYIKSKTIDNIERTKIIIRYFLLLQYYRPLYYYGHTQERFGPSNLFPYLFLTESGVLQISADENTAIFHTEPSIIQQFKRIFSKIEKTCKSLGDIYKGLTGEVSWYLTFLEHANYNETIEMCTGLCSTQFWDKRLISTYINQSLPDIQALILQFSNHCKSLYQAKNDGDTTVLMNPSNVLEFIQTGKFKEYPELFFAKPLSKEDRKLILERVLKACQEGWYHIRFIDESYFPLQYRWEIISHHDVTIIQHFHQEQFRTLLLEEQEFVDAIYDYLEFLSKDQYSMTEKESIDMLKSWSEQYLC